MFIFFGLCLCSLRLFKLKTWQRTIYRENLNETFQNWNQNSYSSRAILISFYESKWNSWHQGWPGCFALKISFMTQVEKGYSHILGTTCQAIKTWAGPKLQQFALPCSWDQHPIQPSWPISARSRGHQYQFPLHLWMTQSLPAETQKGQEIIYTTQSTMDRRQGSLIPWYGQIERGEGKDQ